MRLVRFPIEERPSDSPLVERIWRSHSVGTGTFLSQAKSHWEMVVTRHEGMTTFTVRGPETRATPIECQWTEGEFVGIAFKLGTFMPYLPPGRVMDRRDANLPEATRSSFWLNGSTWQFPDYENADTFVDRLVRNGLLVRDPVVEGVIRGHSHTQAVSLRSIQYRFAHATGLTYSAIQQIARAQRAVALLEQGQSILDVVYAAGYYDQPHLTRALKRFTGQTPAQLARERQPE